MRVIRKLDNADNLISFFSEWEKATLSRDDAPAPASLNFQEQRRILDFPDPETAAANIQQSTKLTKEILLKCAAETPSKLSATEVALLKDRYWLNISPEEGAEVRRARGLISGPYRVSLEEFEGAGKRLEAVRHPYYAENEEKAIANAASEHGRRRTKDFRERQRWEAEKHVEKAFPWVKRLWEEDRGEKHWGYAVYVDPNALVDDQEAEDYMCRRDGVLFHAFGAIGAGASTLCNMWKLERLDWPSVVPALNDEDTELEVVAIFQQLQEHFKSIRDRASKRRRQDQGDASSSAQTERGGLRDGILQNVFLMIDKASVRSVISRRGFVDEMWVWAVDPDFKHGDVATTTEKSTDTPLASGSSYKGFLRVRLQQLVNNFYDARRFHEEEYPMAKLWEAAQKSTNHAFVSVKEEEARSRNMDRFIGSAMRAQPPRIMYGPKIKGATGASVRE